jgi:DNA mismatch endonuclease (patch repair protein)
MDIISKERRSWNMSRIRSANTQPEKLVRSLLHRLGYRFRLHVPELPGRPDVVLPKYGYIIFVNGCFWHRHRRCKFAYTPKSRVRFWTTKFRGNVARDRQKIKELRRKGWRVFVIWECETADPGRLTQRLTRMLKAGRSRRNDRSQSESTRKT